MLQDDRDTSAVLQQPQQRSVVAVICCWAKREKKLLEAIGLMTLAPRNTPLGGLHGAARGKRLCKKGLAAPVWCAKLVTHACQAYLPAHVS